MTYIDGEIFFGGKTCDNKKQGHEVLFSPRDEFWAAGGGSENIGQVTRQSLGSVLSCLHLPIETDFYYYHTKLGKALGDMTPQEIEEETAIGNKGFEIISGNEEYMDEFIDKMPGAIGHKSLLWRKVDEKVVLQSKYVLQPNQGIKVHCTVSHWYQEWEDEEGHTGPVFMVTIKSPPPLGYGLNPDMEFSVLPGGALRIRLSSGSGEGGREYWDTIIPPDKINVYREIFNEMVIDLNILPVNGNLVINGVFIQLPHHTAAGTGATPVGTPIWPTGLGSSAENHHGDDVLYVVQQGSKIEVQMWGHSLLYCGPLLFKKEGHITLATTECSVEDADIEDEDNRETVIKADVMVGFGADESDVHVEWPIHPETNSSPDWETEEDKYRWYAKLSLLGSNYESGIQPPEDSDLVTYTPIFYATVMTINPSDSPVVRGADLVVDTDILRVQLVYRSMDSDVAPGQAVVSLSCLDRDWHEITERNQTCRIYVRDRFMGRFFTETASWSSNEFHGLIREFSALDCLKRLSNVAIIKKINFDGQKHTAAIQKLVSDLAGLKASTEYDHDTAKKLPSSGNLDSPAWRFNRGDSLADAVRTILDVSGGIVFCAEGYYGGSLEDPTVCYVPHPKKSESTPSASFSTDPNAEAGGGEGVFPIKDYVIEDRDEYRTGVYVFTRAQKDSSKDPGFPEGAKPYMAGDIICTYMFNEGLAEELGEKRAAVMLAGSQHYGDYTTCAEATRLMAKRLFYPWDTYRFSVQTDDDWILTLRPYRKISVSIKELDRTEELVVRDITFDITRFNINVDIIATEYPAWAE